MALDFFGANVNNVGLDPLQGFDFEVWSQDESTGDIAFFGAFQSLTLSVRDATETYLELGQRIPIYLNGEIQIAWVLEQGMVDMAFFERTFGLTAIERSKVVTRSPRFRISFDANAAELVDRTGGEADSAFSRGNNSLPSIYGQVNGNNNVISRQFSQSFKPQTTANSPLRGAPTAQGRYELYRCKVDSISMGLMPGRRVAALRWEGVAEGISFERQTLQEFKSQLYNPSARPGFADDVATNFGANIIDSTNGINGGIINNANTAVV